MYPDYSPAPFHSGTPNAGLSWTLTAIAAAIVTVLVVYRIATRSRRRRPW
ncbi:MAG: hypothetical protein IRY84_12825 [Thermobispora bispora]|nr:hypothetical protein [Thermobispora bispora]